MARPVTISDDTLLEAAREVFLEHGIRATSAAVAERAGVSEGTLFKRFGTKQGLFQAAMTVSLEDESKRFVGSLAARVGTGTLRGQLEEVALVGIDFFRKIVPLNMMSWSNPDRPQTAHKTGHPGPYNEKGEHRAVEGRRLFEGYFEGERRAGRLRNVDVSVLARAFMGALYNFVAMEVLTGESDPLPMPAETFARGLVDMLLRGIEATPKTVPDPRPRARRAR
ncbi:MAG: helix-turn-helix transcriptional regulator [Deltaproteobacteria bacterium]|nr:helix-turn-helix transcriptional regulator [Deltaproteobacteria bacterium]